MKVKHKYIIIFLAIIGFVGQFVYESVYVIKPGEQIILTRFGKIEKGPIKDPGYHIKLYRLDQVVRYPSEQTMVHIDFLGCPPKAKAFYAEMNFTITDPIRFYRTVCYRKILPKHISNMINKKYCKDRNETAKENNISIPSLIENEMKQYGISEIILKVKG